MQIKPHPITSSWNKFYRIQKKSRVLPFHRCILSGFGCQTWLQWKWETENPQGTRRSSGSQLQVGRSHCTLWKWEMCSYQKKKPNSKLQSMSHMSATWNSISHFKQNSDSAAALFVDRENEGFYGVTLLASYKAHSNYFCNPASGFQSYQINVCTWGEWRTQNCTWESSLELPARQML